MDPWKRPPLLPHCPSYFQQICPQSSNGADNWQQDSKGGAALLKSVEEQTWTRKCAQNKTATAVLQKRHCVLSYTTGPLESVSFLPADSNLSFHFYTSLNRSLSDASINFRDIYSLVFVYFSSIICLLPNLQCFLASHASFRLDIFRRNQRSVFLQGQAKRAGTENFLSHTTAAETFDIFLHLFFPRQAHYSCSWAFLWGRSVHVCHMQFGQECCLKAPHHNNYIRCWDFSILFWLLWAFACWLFQLTSVHCAKLLNTAWNREWQCRRRTSDLQRNRPLFGAEKNKKNCELW